MVEEQVKISQKPLSRIGSYFIHPSLNSRFGILSVTFFDRFGSIQKSFPCSKRPTAAKRFTASSLIIVLLQMRVRSVFEKITDLLIIIFSIARFMIFSVLVSIRSGSRKNGAKASPARQRQNYEVNTVLDRLLRHYIRAFPYFNMVRRIFGITSVFIGRGR